MSAPVLVQKATEASGAAVTTLTSNALGVGATAGNLLVAFHQFQSAAVVPTTPAGYTAGPSLLGDSPAARTLSVFYKFAVGGETTVTVATGATAANVRLGFVEISGVDPAAPIGITSQFNAGTTTGVSIPSATTAASTRGLLVFAYVGLNAGSGGTFSGTNSYDFTLGYNATDTVGLGVRSLPTGTAGESTVASWTTSRKGAILMVGFQAPAPAGVLATRRVVGRTIGGQATWGSQGETWADTSLTHPSGGGGNVGLTSWAMPVYANDLETKMLTDPSTSEGVPVGPVASGGLRLVVEALNPTVGSDQTWGTATWGISKWSSSVGNWVDISAYVRGVSWGQGIESPNGKAQVGTAALTLDNIDGVASPWAISGVFTGFGSSWLRAGLIVRVGVLSTLTPAACLPVLMPFNPFFTGKVELVDEQSAENADSWVVLTLVETTVDVGTVNPVDQPVTSGRALSSVIFSAMVAAGWQYQTSLDVPVEDACTPATTLSGGSSNERLERLTDGMHWDWVADGRGRIIVVKRHLPSSAGSFVGPCGHTATINFANKPGVGDMPAAEITTYSTIERVLNYAAAARVEGGALVAAEDARSMAEFGTIATGYGYPRDDLVLADDAGVAFVGARVISLRAWDDLGVATISLDMDMDPVNLPAVMTYIAAYARETIQFGVTYTHPSGAVFTEPIVIEGQHHDIVAVDGERSVQIKWTCTLTIGHAGIVTGS